MEFTFFRCILCICNNNNNNKINYHHKLFQYKMKYKTLFDLVMDYLMVRYKNSKLRCGHIVFKFHLLF